MDYSRIAGQATTSVEPQVLPVRDAMSNLSGASAELLDLLSSLEKRLDTVLGTEPPVPVGNEVAGKSRGTVANEINSQASMVRVGCSRLQSILNRLEL